VGAGARLTRLEHALIEEWVLSTALSSRVGELTAISRAGRAVASTLSLDDVLRLILESAQDLLGATEGSVMLLDEGRENLRIAAAVGLDDSVQPVIPIGEGVAGWVAEFRSRSSSGETLGTRASGASCPRIAGSGRRCPLRCTRGPSRSASSTSA
jgi:hypothetical protein